MGCSRAISSLKCLKLRLCWPSIRADSGSGWTSTMMPSAPAATEARAMSWTMYQWPVPWEGSTTMGRWVRRRRRGMALRSRVKREEVSKVRMPRSQSMTSGLPPARMYSAHMSHSSMVLPMPRLSRTGFPQPPTSQRSG